jgi:uncharacterized protein (DUF2141 family)
MTPTPKTTDRSSTTPYPRRSSRTRASLTLAIALALATFTGSDAASAEEEAKAGNTIVFRANLRAKGGVVRCGLFDRKGWLERTVAADVAKANGAVATCTFKKIRPGTYGISAFHDENSNGKLDTNIVGYPVEDYCASRNARNMFSAPSFDDAKFEYKGGEKRLEAHMK